MQQSFSAPAAESMPGNPAAPYRNIQDRDGNAMQIFVSDDTTRDTVTTDIMANYNMTETAAGCPGPQKLLIDTSEDECAVPPFCDDAGGGLLIR